ncbi:MAG: fibronectin type III domain-containing protein, partial [Muribaculaceae bacterium]|nr:fibronectin type III domain-containing protein [Muribaculaceae bacterium]
MKQKLLKLLSIFVAFLTAIPIANAANITFSVSKQWEVKGTFNGTGTKGIAVSNNKVYLASYNSANFAVVDSKTSDNSWPEVSTGLTSGTFGFGVDNDDVGNVIVKVAGIYYDPAAKFVIYKAGDLNSNYSIDLSGDFLPGARADFLAAQGDLYNGIGYIWLAPNSDPKKIMRITIQNKKAVEVASWPHDLPSSSEVILRPLEDGRLYYHCRSNTFRIITLPASGTNITTSITQNISTTAPTGGTNPVNVVGSDMFILQGNVFHVRSAGESTKDISFLINNLNTSSALTYNGNSIITPFNGVDKDNATNGVTTSAGRGTIMRAVKVDACNYDIYGYSSNHGVSCYRVTANVTVNTVTNVNTAYVDASTKKEVKLSWNAPATDVPSKYVIKYSSDGGTTWSDPVETTALSYTFTGLPTGTYTFKVSPYYEQYLTYGAEVKSAEIYMQEKLPTGYVFTVSKKWEASGTLNNDGDETTPAGKSIAVSNEMLYVSAMNQYGTISYVNNNNSTWPNFNSGYNKGAFGYGMDNDDAGNIIVAANSVGTSTPKKFAVYPAGATSNANKKEFTLGDAHLPGGRADYIGATGDIFDGTGYLWFAPAATKDIKRIKIENKSGVPTSTEITTWTHSFSDNSSEVIVRPLEDGRLYFHNHQNQCKIFTLPAGGGAIPSANVENVSLTTTQTNNFSSDAIILKGNVLNIRNAGVADQDISFEIYNTTTGGFATYNNERVITPFGGKRTTGETNPLSGIAKIGSIVRAVKVNDETADVYVYSPFHGASCYRIGTTPIYVVTGPLTSLVYEYLEVPTDEGTRRDIKLTWGAPEGDTPTSYRIYRGGTLIATVDGSELTYTNEKVNANYTYTVIPYYDGVPEDESLGKSVTTTEVETVMYAPIITEMRTYNGYSIAQFFFKMPSLSTIKPVSFNIYRGDQLIESGITQYNYIDDGLPKIDVDKEYTYYVEAVYSDTYNNATRKSLGEPVKITYRDWALAGYMIEEIYNVPINQAIGNLPNNFTNYDYYRQGQFYNGHWYIAQRADDLCQKDQDKANGITNSVRDDMKSDNADATGGVVVIKATEEPDVRMGFTGKILTNDAFENVGIAMDDKGTIFMRNNNVTKLAATTPSDGNATEVAKLHDGFGRRITEGHLYTRNADGSYSATPTTLDLQALWLDNRWIDNMVYTSGKSYGQVAGRSDYYHMWGDVMSAEGGYLILAPSWTRTAFKVKIVNGAYVSHEKIEFSDYTETNPTTGELEKHILATGSENYGFKIAGRDAWMAQIRSNGYFGVHDEGNGQIDWHAIFDTDSRINNSGGTSIVAFGNAADDSDGETFLITPACMYSRNTGDFIVTRGIKDNIGDAASESKLSPPMPVAQFKQINTSSNIATNANGNWFHAEPGTYESATDANAECVYIYQYVPGMRFAKYRLFPDNQLPQVTPTLDITTKYDNAENPTEITHFGGVSTWKRPKKFGLSDASNANVKVKSYSFELLNAKGEVVYEDEVLDKDYAAGTNPTEESELFVYEFDYVSDKNIENVDNCDLDFQTYTARVAVNYEFSNGAIKQSQFNSAIDNNDYPAEPVQNLAAFAFKQANQTVDEWVEKDGQWVVEQKQVDNYRVEINFDKPDCDEPVS